MTSEKAVVEAILDPKALQKADQEHAVEVCLMNAKGI